MRRAWVPVIDSNKERRNHYRILHVQPEAPTEVITASYRSLMSTLRRHPDLGGDHETAAVINQAYAVLSDPARRRDYDLTLLRDRRLPVRLPPAGFPGPGAPGGDEMRARAPAPRACLFCDAPAPVVIAVASRCGRCDGPLAPIAGRLAGSREMLGRRTSARVNRSESAMLHPGWRLPVARARLRDLSPTGISVFTAAPVANGTVVRIVGSSYDVLARVVQVRPRTPVCTVHAELLTACFAGQAGVFVSLRV